jgi:hypothetical protein
MRYVSAEKSIAAAGAAFAYVEDDSLAIHKSAQGRGSNSWFGRSFWRVLLATGLVLA